MKRSLLKYFSNQDRIIQDSVSGLVDLMEHKKESEENPVERKLHQIQSDINSPVRNIKEFSELLLSSLARILGISQGAFFLTEKKNNQDVIKFLSGYAYSLSDTGALEFEFGQGLPGQVALDGEMININSIPEGYITILSGLGNSSPGSMIIFPVINKEEVIAVIELASFREFNNETEELIRRLSTTIAERIIKLNKKIR